MVRPLSAQTMTGFSSEQNDSLLTWATSGIIAPLVTLHLNPSNCSLTSKKFSYGQSNPTYLITITSNSPGTTANLDFNFVIRTRPHGNVLASAHRIDREFRVLAALTDTPVPTPRVYAYCDDNGILGTPFFAMEYVKGRIFQDASMLKEDPTTRSAVYQEVLQVLSCLSRVDINAIGLENISRTDQPWLDRQLTTWYKQYRASRIPGRDYNLMEALHSRLTRRKSELQTTEILYRRQGLVHGDFRLDNLVFHESKPVCIAVLDWELVALGDPVADFATFITPFFMPKESSKIALLQSTVLRFPRPKGIPSSEQIISAYSHINQQNSNFLPEILGLYVAVSMFRVAAILYGVQWRALQGSASSNIGGKVGAQAHLFVRAAQDLLKRNAIVDMEKDAMTSKSMNILSKKPDKEKLISFMSKEIFPREDSYFDHARSAQRWKPWPPMEMLKEKAKSVGLWNLFLPIELGGRLKNEEYSPLAEIMGQCVFASEVFNCSPPDTGNMELLIRYGTDEQRKKYLLPLLNGDIRSCFAMTEPDVASSDPTNLSVSITSDGPNYVINGRKWWSSGAMDPRCKLIFLIGLGPLPHSKELPKHKRHTIILIPMSTSGVRIIRPLSVFGYDDAPHGHAEIEFTNVKVPKSESLLHTEGGGFEAAQSRLGGGRLHHCMRLVGSAERACSLAVERAASRTVFGKPLIRNDTFVQKLAEASCNIESARLLTRAAAVAVDGGDVDIARRSVAIAKLRVPDLVCQVIDMAIQVHGGMGLCQDSLLGMFYAHARALRIADGPDEVHGRNLARIEVRLRSRL